MTHPTHIAPTPKKQRALDPRGQLRYHQRCAARAHAKADWLAELADRHAYDWTEYGPKIEALRIKANAHLRACVQLNDEHSLGYPVTPAMRRTLGMPQPKRTGGPTPLLTDLMREHLGGGR